MTDERQALHVVNFGHPLTQSQRDALAAVLDERAEAVQEHLVAVHLDLSAPMEAQLRNIVAGVKLSSQEWQSGRVVLALPGLAAAAGVLLAITHGLAGDFLPVVRLRPADGPLGFELAEVLDLRSARATARTSRFWAPGS
jgi:hypothetical protein